MPAHKHARGTLTHLRRVRVLVPLLLEALELGGALGGGLQRGDEAALYNAAVKRLLSGH